MFRRSTKTRLVIMTLILVMSILLDVGLALAVTTPPSATITLTVVSEKKLAGKPVGVTGLDISLQDAAGYDLVLNKDFTRGTDTAGLYRIFGLSTGNYSLTVARNGYKETVKVSITALREKKVSMTYIYGFGSESIDKTKAGAIGGIIFDNLTGNPVASPVKVRAVGPTSTYEVMTDSTIKGQFKFYVALGKYYIVTESTNDSYKNSISSPVNVIAGQTVTPLLDSDLMVNNVQWPSGGTDKQLGLTVPTILPNARSITGEANVGTTVTALVYSDTLQRYSSLASTVALKKRGAATDAPGTYTLTLPTVQPEKKIKIVVTDKAFNSYTDLTNDNQPIGQLSVTSPTNDPLASTAVDMKLGFTDTTSTFLKSVTSVVYNSIDDGYHNFPIEYSTTKNRNKLTILAGSAGIIPIGTNYNIIVKATGFTDTKWTGVAVKSSTVPPPAIAGTLSWLTGTTIGSTHLDWVQPALTSQKMDINHKLMYKISATDLSVGSDRVFLSNTLADATDYNHPDDITGVLPNQWVGVVEVDKASLKIFKFKSHKLAVKEVKGPSLTDAVLQTVYGYTIALNFNAALDQTKVPPITSFTVRVTPLGGTATLRSLATGGVTINNQTVTLTLSGAPIQSTDKVTLAYTAPSTNYLQDSSTRGVASIPSTTPLALYDISGDPITGLAGPLQLGRTTTATAITTEPGAVGWTSSTPAVATVDANTGVVTALTAGKTIISYMDSTSHHINSQMITVYAATLTPALTIDVVQLGEGNVTPTGFITAGTGETIVWTSTDPSKASVAVGTGVITPFAVGSTTISYQVTNDLTHAIKAEGSKDVTVYSTATIANLIIGTVQVGEGNVTPTGFTIPGTGQTTTWTSSGPDKATIVSTTGEITPIMAGATTISYKVTDDTTYAVIVKGSQYLTVYSAARAANPTVGPLQLGEGTVTPTGFTSAVIGETIAWTSSKPDIATVVSDTGVITPVAAGATTISYKVTNSASSIVTVKGSKDVTVFAVTDDTNPIISTLQVGEGNVTPTGFTPAGTEQTIAWTSSAPSIATVVSGTGVITPVKAGDTTISYRVTDNTTHVIVAKGSTVVTIAEAKTLDLTCVEVDVAAGKITGTTTAMHYSLTSTDGSNGTWISASSSYTPVTFGTGKVYVRQANKLTNFRLVATL